MILRIRFLILGMIGVLVPGIATCGLPDSDTARPKKVVLIAGIKSHEAGQHEYIKTVRLIKTMLDKSGLKSIKTEIHTGGWPSDETTLDNADLILFISDGRDGHLYSEVPFMQPDRMKIIEKQMNRGCGFSLLHFSTFSSDHYSEQVLEWGGGYFDWEDDNGQRNWYSSISNLEADVQPANSNSPVLNGVKPFRIKEEFYYNIRFREADARLQPLLQIPSFNSTKPWGNVVAWTVQRENGGRGFSTTMGHYFSNWDQPDFRKFMLNGIVWAAGAEVPPGGVESRNYSDKEVTQHLYGKTNKALVLTGNNHPAHPWRETTRMIKKSVEDYGDFFVDVSTNIEDLAQYNIRDYDVLIMNYCNWEDSTQLSPNSKTSFVKYLDEGGGLMIIHFANGAFHKSLPGAGNTDWPEYRKICRRIWDHDSGSSHDNYQAFKVRISPIKHPITSGLKDFITTDELYFNQKGAEPISPLLTAKSVVSGKEEPLAWTYNYGQGRIFQTLLGHDAKSFEAPEVQRLIGRAAKWCANEKLSIAK